jgi:pimeloyl-ACP methyl ester carboxylesterase
MRAASAAALVLCALSIPAEAAAQAVAPLAPIADPDGLLPPAAKARIGAAASEFRAETGRWMAVVVGLRLPAIQPDDAPGGVGLVLAASRDDGSLRLVLVDPAWRAAAPETWADLVASRTETRFRGEDFAERVALSAELLARILPDKLAFMTRPPSTLGEGSYTFARYAVKAIELFVWLIILYTGYRTVRENRLKDSDRDAFSNELRRLREQENRW